MRYILMICFFLFAGDLLAQFSAPKYRKYKAPDYLPMGVSKRDKQLDKQRRQKERRVGATNALRRQKRKVREQAEATMDFNQINRIQKQVKHQILQQWTTAIKLVPDKLKTNEIRLPDKFRAIAEVRIPKTVKERRNQRAELQWFASQGFDTVVLVWRGEPYNLALRTIDWLDNAGWYIIIAHGPSEKRGTAYPSLLTWRELMETTHNSIDVVLPSWRMSSLPHYQKMKDADSRILVMGTIAQQAANNLPVFGEVYMKDSPLVAAPSGVSGVVLHNAGSLNVMEERMLERANHASSVSSVVPAVIGPAAYYDSYAPQKLDKKEIWRMKQQCVDNYLQAGARGVIVFAGDGAGDRKDNVPFLTKSQWRSVK